MAIPYHQPQAEEHNLAQAGRSILRLTRHKPILWG